MTYMIFTVAVLNFFLGMALAIGLRRFGMAKSRGPRGEGGRLAARRR